MNIVKNVAIGTEALVIVWRFAVFQLILSRNGRADEKIGGKEVCAHN